MTIEEYMRGAMHAWSCRDVLHRLILPRFFRLLQISRINSLGSEVRVAGSFSSFEMCESCWFDGTGPEPPSGDFEGDMSTNFLHACVLGSSEKTPGEEDKG